MSAEWLAQNWPGIASVVAVIVAGAGGVKMFLFRSGRDSSSAAADSRAGNITLHQGSSAPSIAVADAHTVDKLATICAGITSLQTAMAQLAQDRRDDIRERSSDRELLHRVAALQEQLVGAQQQQTDILRAIDRAAVLDGQRQARAELDQLERLDRISRLPGRGNSGSTSHGEST